MSNSKNQNVITYYHAAFAQSIGKKRDQNEDSVFVHTGITSDYQGAKPFGLFIVADGMGGYEAGEAASAAAVHAVSASLLKSILLPFINNSMNEIQVSIHEAIERSIIDAQIAVNSSAPGGGTTIIVALILDNQVTLAHIGDSRAYFLGRDKSIVYLTKDHSVIQKMVEMGEISEEEAKNHPNRNYLYKAIGQDKSVKADIVTHAFRNDSRLLLCSDGLWGTVSEKKMINIASRVGNIQTACNQLTDEANKAGGSDNISVILVEGMENYNDR